MSFSRDLPITLAEALRTAREILATNRRLVETGVVDVEAELIVRAAVEQSTGRMFSRMDLFSRQTERCSAQAGELVLRIAGGRAQGRILQHLTGVQDFLDHRFEVNSSVLVPRPETEVLVGHAIHELKSINPKRGIEIGLGSGAISISVLAAFPKLTMIASEVSAQAILVARRNAQRILDSEASRLEIVKADQPTEVWEPFERSNVSGVDFIISNPPYLEASDEIEQDVAQHEPPEALYAPQGQPLYFYEKMAKEAQRFLKPKGILFCEMPHERARQISQLFANGSWTLQVVSDLSGRQRVLIARLSAEMR